MRKFLCELTRNKYTPKNISSFVNSTVITSKKASFLLYTANDGKAYKRMAGFTQQWICFVYIVCVCVCVRTRARVCVRASCRWNIRNGLNTQNNEVRGKGNHYIFM
jgi:hypothetical protein